MNLQATELTQLTLRLRERSELLGKLLIQPAAKTFGAKVVSHWFPETQCHENGDDTAALRLGEEYVLFAAEGMHPQFVAHDPWFAGFSSLMVNVNDVAAMGGRPWAAVDVLMGSRAQGEILAGLHAASRVFGVPIVGGHTGPAKGEPALSVAILGRAKQLIPSSGGRPGQVLLFAVALDGAFRGNGNFDAATTATAETLQARLAVLPELAERSLVSAGKDVSMAGLCGTLLMLLEASGCGATLDLSAVPAPPNVDAERWLTAFPSFGFLLCTEPGNEQKVKALFEQVGVTCARVGTLEPQPTLTLCCEEQRALYWNLEERALTGFGSRRVRSSNA